MSIWTHVAVEDSFGPVRGSICQFFEVVEHSEPVGPAGGGRCGDPAGGHVRVRAARLKPRRCSRPRSDRDRIGDERCQRHHHQKHERPTLQVRIGDASPSVGYKQRLTS